MPDLDDVQWELPPEVDPGVGLLEEPIDGPMHAELIEPVDRRVFLLVASSMPTTEADALRAVFEGCRGRAGTTMVTPPGEEDQVEVEFLDDRLDLTWVAGDTWQARVRVREVL